MSSDSIVPSHFLYSFSKKELIASSIGIERCCSIPRNQACSRIELSNLGLRSCFIPVTYVGVYVLSPLLVFK